MGRPATKQDLLKAAEEQFYKMWKVVDTMTEEQRRGTFDFSGYPKMKEAHWSRDKNLRDILVHLYEWHQLLLRFVEDNLNGKTRSFLPEPYNWKTCAQMNVEIWKKHQSTSEEDAKKMLLESHQKVLEMIEGFSNEELFEAKHFTWTGTTSLGSYCVSATSSHYEWAMKKMKAHIRSLKEAREAQS